MIETTIDLDAVVFGRDLREFARSGGISVSAFRYASGVAAVRIVTSDVEIDLLPYQGQQVWRASVHGRALTMQSMFDEPRPTRDYLGTYGAFLIHCGALAMGNPGPGDDHPLHGELPNAPYVRAQLVMGCDDAGPYAALTGEYEYARSFGHHYTARPRFVVPARGYRFRADMTVRNVGRQPMPLMYLAHLNFRPVDGARVIDSFGLEQMVEANCRVDPEQVTSHRASAGNDGWAFAIQLHPQGSADFVRYRPAELPHRIRWLVRDGDQDAFGFALPATAGVRGALHETEAGNVRSLDPDAEFSCGIEFGELERAEAAQWLSTVPHG